MTANRMHHLHIPCEYFDMDPHELTSHQLDYELLLRNKPTTGTARQKAQRVQQLLQMEVNGNRELMFLNNSPMQSAYDLEHCSFLCHELNEQLKEPTIDSRTLKTYWSRAVHLAARLERINPNSQMEHCRKQNLLYTARAVKFAIGQRSDPNMEGGYGPVGSEPMVQARRKQKKKTSPTRTSSRHPHHQGPKGLMSSSANYNSQRREPN